MRVAIPTQIFALSIASLTLAACGDGDAGTTPVVTGDAINVDTGGGNVGGNDTTTLPDTAKDTGGTDSGDAGTPIDEYPEWFGQECSDNSQCKDDAVTGFCVEDAEGEKTCTVECTENCPEGYGCAGVQLGGADPTFVCVKKTSTNCEPCETDGDCIHEGARCIDIGENDDAPDKRCAMPCDAGQACGEGYQCVSQEPSAGAGLASLCVPTTESCICFGETDGTSRQCSKAQEGVGTCYGTETCDGAKGWIGCSAQDPAAETCNTVDDDCDGKTDEDEDLSLTACEKTNDFGTCAGQNVCDEGAVTCSAVTPAAETCNGIDDDCDGSTDEGLADNDGDETCDDQDVDDDGDGTPDATDNCDFTANPDQADSDKDGIGDACETDCDNDGAQDGVDNCKCVPNVSQADFDEDGLGDACDDDSDGDGIKPPVDCNDFDAAVGGAIELCDGKDNTCNNVVDEGFPDTDGDQLKDCLDTDDDNDGDPDTEDCSPSNGNVGSSEPELCDGIDNNCDGNTDEGFPDFDEDGTCDGIDTDQDDDGFTNDKDNCPTVPNPDQTNSDKDFPGDACDTDKDGDGVLNTIDNCQLVANSEQTNLDGDALGDACDSDDDGDGKPEGSGSDCNDKDAAVYFGAPEVCDDKDNNCNTTVDEGFLDTDLDQKKDCVDDDDDGDGYPDELDCAPQSVLIGPDAPETCDGFDNNCNIEIDEGCPPTSVNIIFPSAVVTGTTASGLKLTLSVGVPGIVGTVAPAGPSGYAVDWGFYYTLP